jgi:hypothetical protein
MKRITSGLGEIPDKSSPIPESILIPPEIVDSPAASNFCAVVDDPATCVDPGLEDFLRSNPNRAAHHFGWNFHGILFFQDGAFVEVVQEYRVITRVVKGGSLHEVIQTVNDVFGWI